MGYTTTFKGQFNLNKLPTAEVILQINMLSELERETRQADMPDSYCDWELTKDLQGLKHNGAEKSYYYEQWLQYIIDNILTPNDIELSGEVSFRGEDVEDFGTLKIENGKVVNTKGIIVSEEFGELKEFKDFVLSRFDEDGIIREEWLKRKRI